MKNKPKKRLRKPITPKSRIKSAIRRVFLHSRERAAALKASNYCCAKCGIKQSSAKGRQVKLEVHHEPPIDWNGVVDLVYDRLLATPMIALCKECHKKIHKQDHEK